MTITVRMSPGTSTWQAFEDAWRLARQLSVNVEFTFNDSLCMAFIRGEGIEWRNHELAANWRLVASGAEIRERGSDKWESETQWLERKAAEPRRKPEPAV
jgi:hypothetical protein